MQIEKKKLTDLIPADYNPRKALKKGDKEYEKIKRSIDEFGFVQPVIWNKRTARIVGGHQRVSVLKDNGVVDVDCVVVDLDEDREKALNIALNKITGEWDERKLALLFSSLDEEGFDLTVTGFDTKKINSLLGTLGDFNIEEDDFDIDKEIKNPRITKEGDVWHLGRNTLVCKSAADEKNIRKAIKENAAVDLMLLDIDETLSDNLDTSYLESVFISTEPVLKKGATYYIWHKDKNSYAYRAICKKTGWQIRQCIIWVKDIADKKKTDYKYRHEPCLVGWREGASHSWYSDRKQTTVLEYDVVKSSKTYLELKPLSLLGYIIQNSSKKDDLVLCPKAGVGSALIACYKLQRVCILFEEDVKLCDVVVKRFSKLTEGKEKITCIRGEKEYSLEELEKIQEK